MLGPIPQLTSSSVREQLDGGTGSEQLQLARPCVPEEQLPTFATADHHTNAPSPSSDWCICLI